MISIVEDFIDCTHAETSAASLKKRFLAAVQAEGYENAVFARARNSRLVSIPWSEFPPGYLDIYKAKEWDKIDPVVQHLQTARTPFRWTEACRGPSPTQRIFFEQCRELRVHSGITIPIHGPGREVDLISLSLREKSGASPERTTYVYMLAVQYWLKYCELVDGRGTDPTGLTGQEIECLRWCKEGKTNWEIGEILGISQKTVEFHVGNTMKKLGASNRITAVIMGIKNGIISL